MTGERIDSLLKLFCISRIGHVSIEPSWQSWFIFSMSMLGSVLLASSGVFFQLNHMRRSEIICFSMSCAGLILAAVTFLAILIGCITRRRYRATLRDTRVSVRNTRRAISLESISMEFNKEALTTPTEAENEAQWTNTAFDYQYNDLLLYTRSGRREGIQDSNDSALRSHLQRSEKNHQPYENLQRNEDNYQPCKANFQRNENNHQSYETLLQRNKINYQSPLQPFETDHQPYETPLQRDEIHVKPYQSPRQPYERYHQPYETDHQPYETDFDDIDSNSFDSSSETRTCSYNSCCSEDEGYFQTLSSSKESDLSDCYFENKRYCRWIPEHKVFPDTEIDANTGNSFQYYNSKLDPQLYLHNKMTSEFTNMLNCRKSNSGDFENFEDKIMSVESLCLCRGLDLDEENRGIYYRHNYVESNAPGFDKPSNSGSQQSNIEYKDSDVNMAFGNHDSLVENNLQDEYRRFLEISGNSHLIKYNLEYKNVKPTFIPDLEGNQKRIWRNDLKSSVENREYYLQYQVKKNRNVRENLNPEVNHMTEFDDDSISILEISENPTIHLKYDDHATLASSDRNIKPSNKDDNFGSPSRIKTIPQTAIMYNIDYKLPTNSVEQKYSSNSSSLSNRNVAGKQRKSEYLRNSQKGLLLPGRTCKLSNGSKYIRKQRPSKYIIGIESRIKKRPLLDANGVPMSQAALVRTLTELFQNGLPQ